MQSLILGAIAVFAGVLLGYWLGKAAAQAESRLLRERVTGLETEKTAQAEAAKGLQNSVTNLTGELRAMEAQVAAEKNKYAQMQADMEKAFGDLAAKALSANNQSFLTLAKQELEGQSKNAKQTLEAKELAIKTMLDPLGAALKSLDEQARAMEVSRSGAYSEVKTLVENMQNSIPASLAALKNETAQLIMALRAPKTRGNWRAATEALRGVRGHGAVLLLLRAGDGARRRRQAAAPGYDDSTAEWARDCCGREDTSRCISGCDGQYRSGGAEVELRSSCAAREGAHQGPVEQGVLETV
jgi:hypothetical protein